MIGGSKLREFRGQLYESILSLETGATTIEMLAWMRIYRVEYTRSLVEARSTVDTVMI